MKVVILAGGFGTRLVEETAVRPKPMVELGGNPVLWHIMKIYSTYGLNEFIICLGYKGYFIKEYFANYFLHRSDVTFDLKENRMDVHSVTAEPWRVTLVDTGEATQTGGRIKRVLPYLKDDAEFCLTYGDGIADVDIAALIARHRNAKRLATVTAAQPPSRFGMLDIEGGKVTGFKEKPDGEGGWVSAGFFVLSPKVGDYIAGDETLWEREPLERLAAAGELGVHLHRGFWQPMDTLRDKMLLESLWASGSPPWKIWQ
ncbi:MAG TPA: glucose-1-phosphate cytidylyltransferase [Pseudolabrys sp.]|nr:glucose-1-phosphate cytidylyltransferase [Pseudolabrys sp.]